jgi:KDO2-lipid IV(A) lauroyltransferase
MQGSIVYFALSLVTGLIRILPVRLALFIGRRTGDIVRLMNAKIARKVSMNLRLAYGQKKSTAELQRLERMFFRSYGQNIIELARLPLVARVGYERFVKVEGKEHLDAAMKRGKGAILLSMHSGNWELSSLVASMLEYPYSLVANDLRHIDRVADFLDSLRKSAGCNIINPGIAGREIVKRLKANEIVTLVADQGGAEGVKVDFLGHQASMSTGALRIALKHDAAILLVDIHRLSAEKHHLKAVPFELTRTGDLARDLEVNLKRMVTVYEGWIDQHPYEYIWSYKTWKYSGDRSILLLDDGRTGHLRQSESVARLLGQELSRGGFKPVIHTVRVEFRVPFFAFLFNLISGGRVFFRAPSVYSLRLFLTDESFSCMVSLKPDYVISAGARAAGLNIFLARANLASNIAILRPGHFPLGLFTRVILPRHDIVKAPSSPGVIEVQTAPNLVDRKYLEDNALALQNRFSHLKSSHASKLGVLVGGDTRGLVMYEQQIRVILHQLKDIAERFQVDLLVTTSRRTSVAIEQVLSRELKDFPRTALLIIANRSNVPEAVGGILGLSDHVVVSGESISMVSEAAASGKKTVVFPVDGPNMTPVRNKYTAFAEELAARGHIACSGTRSLADTLDGLFKNKIRLKPVNDSAVISAALKGIVR